MLLYLWLSGTATAAVTARKTDGSISILLESQILLRRNVSLPKNDKWQVDEH